VEQVIAATFLAIATNRIVEAFVAPVKKKWPTLDLWWVIYVAWIVGGLLSYESGLNLVSEVLPKLNPDVGAVLTAVVVGGGANLIAQVFPTSGRPKDDDARQAMP
jgi:hypothetical protein